MHLSRSGVETTVSDSVNRPVIGLRWEKIRVTHMSIRELANVCNGWKADIRMRALFELSLHKKPGL
jgi:hypothetical protein